MASPWASQATPQQLAEHNKRVQANYDAIGKALSQGVENIFNPLGPVVNALVPNLNAKRTTPLDLSNPLAPRSFPSFNPQNIKIPDVTQLAKQYVGTHAPTTRRPAVVPASTTTSPNTIRTGVSSSGDDAYRQLLSQYGQQRQAAATALKGYQPGSGPMPAAATQALQTGRDIWAQKYKDTLAKPGGAIGTYNPLMQARGDVPSMADLWSGMKSIQAPTGGPGKTSEDVTDEAMQQAAQGGRYFAPSGGPIPDPVAQQQRQQMQTAFQAAQGTEEPSAAQRTQEFLRNMNLKVLNPGSYNFPGDAAAIAQPSQFSTLFK